MKLTKTLTMLGLSTVCIFSASVAIADHDSDHCILQGKPVPVSQIEKNVKALGFTPTKEYFEKHLKLDDCTYKVKVKDSMGRKWKLYFDPTNGKFIGKKAKD